MLKCESGEGSYDLLPSILSDFGAGSVLIVCTRKTRYGDRLPIPLNQLLSSYRLSYFHDFTPVPKITDIYRGMSCLASQAVDTIIAVGGGTVMDIAKAIAILSSQTNPDYAQYIRSELPISQTRHKRLVLLPTTGGSGSEVTQFAVVYVGDQKFSLDHPYIRADWALIDPRLSHSAPPLLTATTGMDALCQAIESYWSVKSTNESRAYSVEAIPRILTNLNRACNQPTPESRAQLSIAATMAGHAINITRTTAPHAVSYPLTAYHNVAHGHACAITLPHFMTYNAEVTSDDVVDLRGREFVRARMREILSLIEADTPENGRAQLVALGESIGLKMRLRDLGISNVGLERIVANSSPSRMKNNPRLVTENALRSILKAAF